MAESLIKTLLDLVIRHENSVDLIVGRLNALEILGSNFEQQQGNKENVVLDVLLQATKKMTEFERRIRVETSEKMSQTEVDEGLLEIQTAVESKSRPEEDKLASVTIGTSTVSKETVEIKAQSKPRQRVNSETRDAAFGSGSDLPEEVLSEEALLSQNEETSQKAESNLRNSESEGSSKSETPILDVCTCCCHCKESVSKMTRLDVSTTSCEDKDEFHSAESDVEDYR
ncbi:hypothetical protein L596_009563 [Steinernema carpocapsae]|uniref:Uncharacterized protein n=1 Tax=Steinernema carpocapsae TaxID=34508 RepID=A0A4U5PFQ1_STECR|nr:hypothetical protein L596_009563 [Steinernema carpocapsae]